MELKTNLEELSGVRRRLTVEVPVGDTSSEYEEVARGFHRKAKIPGFRSGKAPIHLVKRHFGDEIRQEILNRLLPSTFKQALLEYRLEPLGDPNWTKVDYQPGSPLIHVAEFEVLPQFEMGMYKGLEIKATQITADEADLDRQLEELRKRHATLEPVEDRPIAEGDYAVIDLIGVETGPDGKEKKELVNQENLLVAVGEGRTHPAFSEALFDLNIAEGKEFTVSYEADYPDRQLAGKRVRFSLEVTDIKTRVLAELSDELAREVGDYENLEELKVDLRDRLAKEAALRKDQGARQNAIRQLHEKTPIEAPQILVENEVDHRLQDYAMRLQSEGVDPLRSSVNWAETRQALRQGAEIDVKTRLLLMKISQVEGIEVSAEELEEEQARMAEVSNQPLEKITQNFADSARQQSLREHLQRKKALQLVMDSAQVVFVSDSESGVE